jgi:GNAT superfamily N-acetyltransferase
MSAEDGSAIAIAEAGAERVGELAPLWADMHAHHAAMADAVAPVRALADSWPRRRREYVRWLASGQARLLIAERAGRPVGYLVLRFESGASTWDIGERVAEVESLSVAAGERGGGVGGRLMAAARSLATSLGAARLLVSVVHANEPALRFYRREGFAPFYVTLLDSHRLGEDAP